MLNYWKIQGVPHKGWRLLDVTDIREDGQSECDTEYECCMMMWSRKNPVCPCCGARRVWTRIPGWM